MLTKILKNLCLTTPFDPSPQPGPVAASASTAARRATNFVVAPLPPVHVSPVAPALSGQRIATTMVESLYSLAQRRDLPWMFKANAEYTQHDIASIREFLLQVTSRGRLSIEKPFDLLQRTLVEVERFFNMLETNSRKNFGELRYDVKQDLLLRAINAAGTKPMALIDQYLALPYFKGKYGMLIDIARHQMESAVKEHYGIAHNAAVAPVRRLVSSTIASVNQGDYVLHVCGLLNLENRVAPAAWEKLLGRVDIQSRAVLKKRQKNGECFIGSRYKEAIPHLLMLFPPERDSQDKVQRNTHPASVLLQICSGLVFHPSYHNPSLTDHQSPVSFENFSRSLALKYFDAVQHDQVVDFFESAFVLQDPCYEAVAENLMNYAAAPVIFHPKPKWNYGLRITENVDGLLAWTQREFVKEYAKEKSFSPSGSSVREIADIEKSRDFAEFLFRNEDRIVTRILQDANALVTVAAVRSIVRADLIFGMQTATRQDTADIK